MRKIIGGFTISLDGFIEGPNGEYDWIIMDSADINESVSRYDCFLFGRRSYDAIKNQDSKFFDGIQCHVFSSSITKVKLGFNLVKSETSDFIKKLKEQNGKDIAIYGGANFLTSLLNMGLVDELHFSIMPVLLGNGKPMISGLENRNRLELYDFKTSPSGIVKVFYNVKNKPS